MVYASCCRFGSVLLSCVFSCFLVHVCVRDDGVGVFGWSGCSIVCPFFSLQFTSCLNDTVEKRDDKKWYEVDDSHLSTLSPRCCPVMSLPYTCACVLWYFLSWAIDWQEPHPMSVCPSPHC
ncbi:hypothetical protein LZ32DRAFT_159983 [Colletotrichum eremochloae]|nr:hypothetical protein LZ32DRAFT_159983 [Colletotrichum eremochloae]